MEIEESFTTSSQTMKEIFLQEDSLTKKIDFSEIKKKYKDVFIYKLIFFIDFLKINNEKQYEQINDKFNQKIQELTIQMDKIAPNLKAIERFDVVKERYEISNKEFELAREEATKATVILI